MYKLPDLTYDYDALEPYVDARTMEIHYGKHHQGYIDKLNAVLEKYSNLEEKSVKDLLGDIDALDMTAPDKIALRNNGGGYLNHKLFWEVMNPGANKNEALVREIVETFGSLESFKEQFNTMAKNRFGSGWSWLVRNESGKLAIYSTANQDSPFMQGHTPILGLDVWEHAYYLRYQNRRGDYIENWWNVIRMV
jgi:superoxide dismutase, Fe-Mn family